MIPYWKIFVILFWKNLWRHRFTFCIQISRKSASEKWVKRCVVSMTKSSENARLFAAIFRPFGGAEKRATWADAMSPVKFRPNRFRFAGWRLAVTRDEHDKLLRPERFRRRHCQWEAVGVDIEAPTSVTLRYCVKTRERWGMRSSPSGSPVSLVFWYQEWLMADDLVQVKFQCN